MNHQQGLGIMSINELAASTLFTGSGMAWKFPTADLARLHLRRFEKVLAQWGYMFGARDVEVTGGDKTWRVVPDETGITTEVTPIVTAPQFDHDGDLLIAQQWLNRPLLDALIELRESPGIAGLVNWQSQKQVVLTQACGQIPIGEQLEDCLRYSRADYWLAADLDEFTRRCRQELREDGSNLIEFKYLTFDPLVADLWIEIIGAYRFIDAGRLGMFQMGRNLSFEEVAAPAAR